MATRFRRLALAAVLLGVLAVPTYADAQDGGIVFPTVGSGSWEGEVIISGYI